MTTDLCMITLGPNFKISCKALRRRELDWTKKNKIFRNSSKNARRKRK